jgi:hypothetical protein
MNSPWFFFLNFYKELLGSWKSMILPFCPSTCSHLLFYLFLLGILWNLCVSKVQNSSGPMPWYVSVQDWLYKQLALEYAITALKLIHSIICVWSMRSLLQHCELMNMHSGVILSACHAILITFLQDFIKMITRDAKITLEMI